jgi:benzoyl-CoA reductase/2-hydroxyglutaryl-CoA dehydratase subunit BcrC/BadD/HgdB
MMTGFATYFEERMTELRKLKREGKKIVGYVPGGFMPEELVWASGAIPVGLNRGGDPGAVLKSAEFIPRFFDTFSRSQIGYWALGEDPLYQMVDVVVVPCTDRNIGVIADNWEMWTGKEVIKYGVPHNNNSDHAFTYYLDGLYLLKAELEKLTGNSIAMDALKKEIDLSNKIRLLLKQISETRKSAQPPISGRDFIRLHHTSFYTDRNLVIKNMESLSQELKGKEGKKGSRIFLVGSSIAEGDYKVYDILESIGADVVIEDFSEGMRPYWEQVKTTGDLMEALADGYFRKRTPPPAFFSPAFKQRFAVLLKLAKEFKVDGILWYSMMYRDSYDITGLYFARIAEHEGFPFLKIMSDYDVVETGPLSTRIEAFIESMVRV